MMTRAYPWDGVGPRERCLLRVVENNVAAWVEVTFDPAEPDTVDEYRSYLGKFSLLRHRELDNFFIESDDDLEIKVTHYAALPTIATVNRIENDVEEGRVMG